MHCGEGFGSVGDGMRGIPGNRGGAMETWEHGRSGAGAVSILVVDDDADLRTTMAMLLDGAGYGVATAADGAAALARLATPPPPDLLLLDLMMPRVDGWDVLDRLAAVPAWAALPVVVCSAAPLTDGQRARLRGMPVLTKPFDLARLLATVRAHCRASPAS